jgi:hypothetical protein
MESLMPMALSIVPSTYPSACDQKVSRGANRSVVKQVSAFVLGELVRQKHERYMVYIVYIYSVSSIAIR